MQSEPTAAPLAVAIMAAGKGTRLKSARPKVLHEIGGQALLLHVIAAARTLVPAQEIVCIVGHQAGSVQSAVAHTGVRFVLQPEQLGTGHAIQQLKAALTAPLPENLLVLSGDVPLIRPETLAALLATHLREQAAMTILTAIPPDPTGYGRVLRKTPGAPEVEAIVEQKSLTPAQLSAPEINSGIYCFRTALLFRELDHLRPANSQSEYYLTDIAARLTAAGERVVALPAGSVDEVLGANTIAEMMHLDSAMRLATARRHMAQGVTIFRPETSTLDATVEIAPDVILEPFVQLLGRTRIGPNTRIRSYAVLQDSTLGEGVLIRQGCVLDHAEIAENAILGPYAHLRPGSRIGPGAHIGNFVETKNLTLGAGSKANHLNYLGDAEIGAGVNIGAGAITCNYDGEAKHKTIIGDRSFIGSDSTLVAPLTLGEGSYIAAGSSITQDVPPDTLAVARSRQANKPGWPSRRRARKTP